MAQPLGKPGDEEGVGPGRAQLRCGVGEGDMGSCLDLPPRSSLRTHPVALSHLTSCCAGQLRGRAHSHTPGAGTGLCAQSRQRRECRAQTWPMGTWGLGVVFLSGHKGVDLGSDRVSCWPAPGPSSLSMVACSRALGSTATWGSALGCSTTLLTQLPSKLPRLAGQLCPHLKLTIFEKLTSDPGPASMPLHPSPVPPTEQSSAPTLGPTRCPL